MCFGDAELPTRPNVSAAYNPIVSDRRLKGINLHVNNVDAPLVAQTRTLPPAYSPQVTEKTPLVAAPSTTLFLARKFGKADEVKIPT